MRTLLTTCVVLLFFGRASSQSMQGLEVTQRRVFSKNVRDSFSVFIHLPEDYKSGKKYPVLYLLDANFIFDMAAVTLDKYSMFAMTDPVIVVGIGYRNAFEMDSLRDREFTFPQALPEYEMSLSGGGERFLNFLNNELIPLIDQNYSTDTAQRILFGHSLGGYFTLFALMKNAQRGVRPIHHYIAGSPSLYYNNYYLFNEWKKLHGVRNVTAYFSFGTLEDQEEADVSHFRKGEVASAQLNALLKASGVTGKSEMFSNLAHMDTPLPTLIRGLQWSLRDYRPAP